MTTDSCCQLKLIRDEVDIDDVKFGTRSDN